MLRAEIHRIIAGAMAQLVASRELPEAVLDVAFDVQDAKSQEHGDFATNFAMAAAKAAGMPPRAIAEKLASTLSGEAVLEKVEVAGPGFINLYLKASYIGEQVSVILEQGDGLPKASDRRQKTDDGRLRINVEFVSVNPNGPITVGSGRGAAFGDTLCRVLEAVGHEVHREYYVNDGVNSEQMRLFAESARYYVGLRIFGEWGRSEDVADWNEQLLQVINAFAGTNRGLLTEPPEHVYDAWLLWAKATSGERSISRDLSMRVLSNADLPYYRENRMRHLPIYLREAWKTGQFVAPLHRFPERGYKADYVKDAASMFVRHKGNREIEFFEDAERYIFAPDGFAWFQKEAQEYMIQQQRQALALFGVQFDTWFSEQSLHDSGDVRRRLDELRAKGAADEEPHRIKLKLGKGGKIDEALREDQPVEEDEAWEEQAEEEEGEQEARFKTLWLRSTKFGDDMDRVLRRKDGRLTYIASDVAYHADKFNRPQNADKLITVLGPDHHGYIGRLHAVVAALLEEFKPGHGGQASNGLTPEEAMIYRSKEERDACLRALEEARKRLEVIIFQIVRFMKDGKPAPMRKRDGNIYELRDLILELGQAQAPNASQEEQERIGADVARFFYLMRSHDTHMDFDIDLATKQSDENPVFYVQYAHARICSVLRKAEEGGFAEKGFDPGLLSHPRELALIKKIVDLPDEVRRAAQDYGVHRLTTYAVELARAFHYFYDACRIIRPDQPELSRARLALAQAARIGLRSTLGLLGVSAPERMERASLE